MSAPRLLTADQVADRLAMSARWVHDHAHELGLVKLGRASRFDESAVDAYIEERKMRSRRITERQETAATPSYTSKKSRRHAARRREILPSRAELLP